MSSMECDRFAASVVPDKWPTPSYVWLRVAV
jgi:hypothetical protein